MDRECTVDAASDAAWNEFRALLADHLDVMAQGRFLVLHAPRTPADAVTPCIQFYGWAADTLRCEVLSDEFLAPHRAWTPAGRALLAQSGFSEPTPSWSAEDEDVPVNWFLDRTRSYVDMIADVSVRILRDVWGVQHPSFVELSGDMSGPLIDHRRDQSAAARSHELVFVFDTFRAVRTADTAELRALVEDTLHHLLGFVPEPDEDGDYPFRLGPAWLYLCPTPEAPFVQILAPLAAGVTDTARALQVINDANRRWPHIKVLLDEDRVLATVDVTVVPFVPQHVIDMLAVMEKFAVEAAEDIVASLGARPYLDAFGDPTPQDRVDDADIPDQLCTIAERIWESGTDLSLDTVLDLCNHDHARIVQFLEVARRCELAALDRTLDDDDPRIAASAGLDARVWRAAAALLTSAHRRLATDTARGPSGSHGSQLDLFGTDLSGGTGDSLFD